MQLIFTIIENKFKNFVKNNIEIFQGMDYNEIINIANYVADDVTMFGYTICSTDMLKAPYDITYIEKKAGMAEDFYVFFNHNMDKIYTHNTAE